jgi:hypothetical protein
VTPTSLEDALWLLRRLPMRDLVILQVEAGRAGPRSWSAFLHELIADELARREGVGPFCDLDGAA